MDAQIALCENAIVRRSAFGENLTRQGSRHPLVAPFGPYATADGHLVVANVKDWPLFCGLIGHDEMAVDPRFSTNWARIENVDALEDGLNEVLHAKTTAEWLAILEPANICSLGKVNTIADLFEDEHVRAREMLVEIPMPYGLDGSLTVPSSPMRMSGTPPVLGAPMPEHGQHSDDVLGGWLGLSDRELSELRQRGVVK
jgi:CoA:oxalate CoA-transferase